jgi:hypothetical protein
MGRVDADVGLQHSRFGACMTALEPQPYFTQTLNWRRVGARGNLL